MRFANSISVVEQNAKNLHAMAYGSKDERSFHRARVRNALHHVIVQTDEGRIFAPAKWSGSAENSIGTYAANKDPVTDHFRRVLRNLGYQQVSPHHLEHRAFYDEFVSYCAANGFHHSKPGSEERHFHVLKSLGLQIYPDEIPVGSKFWEGAKATAVVNRYERDPRARTACISAKGCSCSVCDFNFGEAYGELGSGFIHVHHLVPLHQVDKAYEVDPLVDLAPVCPNCHAMLHRENPPMAIERLRAIMKSAISN